ncbi:hypothetical protein EOD41_10770 [Mucilaginibacter limnophilus]|uniref:Uncharacterized protein n=1 Tax=Mucilaginibacter limnophilus TaxID=1932778 RepID=A0A3S2Y180_9SPHI|nr:HEPN domain-containing protein [Mucilaginibacter limnophilus]RVU01088.1 hypothetical protein EOD41_10770 [Mucilaginibacter limnophilus]
MDKPNILVFSQIKYLEYKGKPFNVNDFTIDEDIQQSPIASVLKFQRVKNIMGELAYFSYKEDKHPCIFVSEVGSLTDIILRERFTNSLNLISLLFWLVKDSSINIQSIYITDTNNGTLTMTPSIDRFTTSGGVKGNVVFTEEEIEQVIKWSNLLSRYLVSNDDHVQRLSSKTEEKRSKVFESFFKNENRIHRAMRFLVIARESYTLQSKIAYYVNVLETLFSTNDMELKHRISERAAFFIGTTGKERIEVYELVGKCYDIRSSYFHGNKMSDLHQNYQERAARLDSLLRQLIQKIIMIENPIFLKNNDAITEYFKVLILQGFEASPEG